MAARRLTRRKASTKPAIPLRKGRTDMECADCGTLVLGVDANASAVHCARCTAGRIAPPELPKSLSEEDRMARSERKRLRRDALAKGKPLPPTARGRVSQYAGKYLYKSRKTNPRQRGHSMAIWDQWSDGATYEQVLALGAKPIDLLYEIKKGWIVTRDTPRTKKGA